MGNKSKRYGGFGTPDSINIDPAEEQVPFPEPPKSPEKTKRSKWFITLIMLVTIAAFAAIIFVVMRREPKPQIEAKQAIPESTQYIEKYNENGFRVAQVRRLLIEHSMLQTGNKDMLLQAIFEKPEEYSAFLYTVTNEEIPAPVLMDYSLVYAVYFTQNATSQGPLARKLVLRVNNDEKSVEQIDEQPLDSLPLSGILYIDIDETFDSNNWHEGIWSIRMFLNDGLVLDDQLILPD